MTDVEYTVKFDLQNAITDIFKLKAEKHEEDEKTGVA